jgi:hypothetical protein
LGIAGADDWESSRVTQIADWYYAIRDFLLLSMVEGHPGVDACNKPRAVANAAGPVAVMGLIYELLAILSL